MRAAGGGGGACTTGGGGGGACTTGGGVVMRAAGGGGGACTTGGGVVIRCWICGLGGGGGGGGGTPIFCPRGSGVRVGLGVGVGWICVIAGFGGITTGAAPFGSVGAGLGVALGVPLGVVTGWIGVTPGLGPLAAGGGGGGGGAPLAPGTGSALVFGSPCGSTFGVTVTGAGVGVPPLTVGVIVALGGTGNLPCWIRVARWATAGGSEGTAPAPRGAIGPAGAPGVGAGGGWLMTLLMTVVLWMLLKMTLFGGGAT